MKILLLGCRGMLGSELLVSLRADHEVTGKDIDDFDIASAADCRWIIEENCPDIVINAVAYTDVDGCEAEREKCFAVNAVGIKNISLACQGKNIRIVHFGTDYVFDGKKDGPYHEDDACRPLNAYGQSKLAGEKFLFELSDNFLLVRTAWLYGGRGKNFVRTILEKAKTVRQLDVVDDQVGCPTYTVDLACAVKGLVEDGRRGLFHVTNGGFCSWYEFAQAILEYAGITEVDVRPIKSDELKRPAIRPCYSVLEGDKYSRVTGITMRPWRIALRDCLEKINSRW